MLRPSSLSHHHKITMYTPHPHDEPRLLCVGLEGAEIEALRACIDLPAIYHETLPKLTLEAGQLWAESAKAPGRLLQVDRVIFHGIFDDDLPFLTTLALWGGPCLNDAVGMMDCRERIPALARACQTSRFGHAHRWLVSSGKSITTQHTHVAKWGNWHCGEGKARVEGSWTAPEDSLVEPFVDGEAVRVMLVADQAWQIRLTGDGWLRSIHHPEAAIMDEVNPLLLEDTRALARRFNFAMVGVDYMIAHDGAPRLLEVNHIPNITVFAPVREAFLELASAWCRDPRTDWT
jgi:hypothetical protein